MKKTIVLIILVISGAVCFGQSDVDRFYAEQQAKEMNDSAKGNVLENIPFPYNDSSEVEFTNVVKVDSADAQTLYSRAKLFIAKTYVSNKAVTQLNDDAGATAVINAILINNAIGFGYEKYNLTYQLTIQCKDNRYKYTITRFMFSNEFGIPKYGFDIGVRNKIYISKKAYNKINYNCYYMTLALIDSLRKFMFAKGEDW